MRRLLIAVLFVAILVLMIIGALRWRSSSPRSPGIAAAALPHVEPHTPIAGVSAQNLEATHIPSPSPQPQQINFALATAQDLRQRSRYPHSSQPLREGEEDPIVRDRQVSQNAFPGPDGEEPALVVFPDQVSFEHPAPVILRAHLADGNFRVPARSIEAEVADSHGQRLSRIEYRDDGQDLDRVADDLEYTARIPAAESSALAGGAYLVRVRALTADGKERTGTMGFLYSRPSAQPTGRYADALVDGNLEVRAEVQVQEEGRFHLEGTLYTQAGTPLAWAQNAQVLSPGTHWIPLSFFGLILNEHGEDGPYLLRFAALSTVTSMPNAKNRVAENVHVTSAYRAADFSDHPFNDPHLIDAAKRLDQDAGGRDADVGR